MSTEHVNPLEVAYVVSPSLRQRLDLAHHLIAFGRQMIVVTGLAGSGRSRLLRAIADEALPQWLTIEIDGRRVDSASALLNALLDALDNANSARPANPEELEARVCRQLAELDDDHGVALLVADDCDAWGDEINALLDRLGHTDNSVGELRAVLSAHANSGYVEHLQAHTAAGPLLHLIEVPRFEPDDAAQLISAAAPLYGRDANSFTGADILELTRRSAGNPARLIALIQPAANQPALRFSPKLQRVGGILIVVCAALGLIALALIGERGETPVDLGIELSLPVSSDGAKESLAGSTLESGETTVAAPNGGLGESHPSGGGDEQRYQGIELALPPAGGEQVPLEHPAAPAVAPTDAANSGSAQPASVTVDAQSGATDKVAPPAAKAEVVAAPAPAPPRPQPSVAVPAPTPPKPAKVSPSSPAYSREWVVKQSNNSYIIQLFGVSERTAAEGFIRQHRIANRSAIFELLHNGKPWFVVTYGHYPSRAAASAAIDKLAAPLRRSGPWPRAVGSLKE